MDGAIQNYVELHIKSAAHVSAAKHHYFLLENGVIMKSEWLSRKTKQPV